MQRAKLDLQAQRQQQIIDPNSSRTWANASQVCGEVAGWQLLPVAAAAVAHMHCACCALCPVPRTALPSQRRSRVLPSGFTTLEKRLGVAQKQMKRQQAGVKKSAAAYTAPPFAVDRDAATGAQTGPGFPGKRVMTPATHTFHDSSVPLGASALTPRDGAMYYPKPRTRWYD